MTPIRNRLFCIISAYFEPLFRSFVQLPLEEFEPRWSRILEQTMARFRDSMIELVGAIMMMAVTAQCLMSGGVGMVLCLIVLVKTLVFTSRMKLVCFTTREPVQLLFCVALKISMHAGHWRSLLHPDRGEKERKPTGFWWETSRCPIYDNPAGFDNGVPLWLARRKCANGVSIHGCVKGASILTRRFVRRVIGERKVFGLVLTSYREDVEDEVCPEVQILEYNERDHKWKVVLGGHEEFVSFAEDRGISVDQHCIGVSIFAIRITQEGSVLPGWLSRGQLIIPLYKYGVTVTVREVLV